MLVHLEFIRASVQVISIEMKPQLSLLLSLLLFASAAILFWRTPARLTPTADPPAMLREIQRLNELVSVKYSIQKVVGFEEQKQPVGTEKLLLIVQAKVLAGVDLSGLTAQQVALAKPGEVLVQLPPAKILHVVVDEKATKVWDRQITWWTPWVPYNQDLERQARIAALDSIKASALEMGILTDAEANARTAIRRLLEAAGIARVTFTPVT